MSDIAEIPAPYLIFVGDESRKPYLKTAFGLVDWRASDCVGQLRLSAFAADLGLPDLNAAEAVARGARTLVVGTALVGGTFPQAWVAALLDALRAGLHVAAGQHKRLNDDPELAAAAAKSGRQLFDVRVPPAGLPVGTGRRRRGRRLLTVGTDCAVGKKYTALSIAREMRLRGWSADFRATGQTGILIAGGGIPIDAVVCDFTSGAAELLSPDADPAHWDVIEGQGSILHPGYAGVSLGLLHGSQPDAIVLCHDPSRAELLGFAGYRLPRLAECIGRNLEAAALTNPSVRCVGVSMNTAALDPAQAERCLQVAEQETGLPCIDPLRGGVGPVLDRIEVDFDQEVAR